MLGMQGRAPPIGSPTVTVRVDDDGDGLKGLVVWCYEIGIKIRPDITKVCPVR